jgi:hypothetical protein
MADLGIKMGFGQFAAEAARCNLPVMGYQMLSSFSSVQDTLTKPISTDLRAFCDRVLLELRIPDSFNLALPLKKRYDALAQKFQTLR